MGIADLVIAVLVVMAAYRGSRRGLVAQVFELGGGLLGLLAGVAFAPRIVSQFTQEAGVRTALLTLLVVVVAVALGQAIGQVVGHHFGLAARKLRLGGVDRGLGALFGAAVVLVAYWLIGFLLVQGPVRPLARAARSSRVLSALIEFRRPPDVVAFVGRYLRVNDFPQVYFGLPPPTGASVELPSGKLARRAALAAKDSTVRILAPACGGSQLGSGWVSSSSTVVTNAHVVAGGSDVTVQESVGSHPATVVLFDPATDVAVLRVEDLSGAPLRLGGPVDRGAGGAVLGYPGLAQGRLSVGAAAVQGRSPAAGLDIYSRARVTREIYQLRASVQEGDSGGPFVRPSGRVAGMVFAASTTDANVGYALTAAEISDELAAAEARTEPVSTGPCTH
ncbi:MAG TPA: MarP family serine protease [Actinomycetota bacterium]|nr:MarP family serine protease [Actinomycetota bacterium]